MSPTVPGRQVLGAGRIERGWPEIAMIAAGALILVLSALPVETDRVSDAERITFHVLNDVTLLPFIVVWPVMQLGNILVVPVAALIAALRRRWRLSAGILLGGLGVYLLAKGVKNVVIRGRPDTLLSGVDIRGEAARGSGYVSGHAAVVTLVAVLVWPYLGTTGRILVGILAGFVCVSRIYVGAHLPLDIVGGAALGLFVAGFVQLILGRPVRC